MLDFLNNSRVFTDTQVDVRKNYLSQKRNDNIRLNWMKSISFFCIWFEIEEAKMFPIVKVQPKSNLREIIACYKYSYFGIWSNCLFDCIIRNYDNDNNDNFKNLNLQQTGILWKTPQGFSGK